MFTSLLLQASGAAGSATGGMADFVTDLSNTIGIDLFDEDGFPNQRVSLQFRLHWFPRTILVDSANEYGIGSVVLHHSGRWISLQDDG